LSIPQPISTTPATTRQYLGSTRVTRLG
jgi:hypothetical protein